MGGGNMKQWIRVTACLLLLLALCACSYESGLKGTWQGDGSLEIGTMKALDGPVPFDGAERWEFDGDSTAVATVGGKEVKLHYYASDDTLTLNDGGEVSWGVRYELKGNTLRIGDSTFTKVK